MLPGASYSDESCELPVMASFNLKQYLKKILNPKEFLEVWNHYDADGEYRPLFIL